MINNFDFKDFYAPTRLSRPQSYGRLLNIGIIHIGNDDESI